MGMTAANLTPCVHEMVSGENRIWEVFLRADLDAFKLGWVELADSALLSFGRQKNKLIPLCQIS